MTRLPYFSILILSTAVSAFAPARVGRRHHRATFFSSRGVITGAEPGRRRCPLPPVILSVSSESSPISEQEQVRQSDPSAVLDATDALSKFDTLQQAFMQTDGMRGMGGGQSALAYLQTQLGPADRSSMKAAVQTLVDKAAGERAADGSKGRVMLGICAENAPEALGGLKTWVSSLGLPRGMLHGMDVDGVPIAPEELGPVYVKFSTGGAMTFKEMRKSGKGFDALWRPGDALLEPYDGDFRGVYFNAELVDGEFRQFGVLPTDLFMEEEEW